MLPLKRVIMYSNWLCAKNSVSKVISCVEITCSVCACIIQTLAWEDRTVPYCNGNSSGMLYCNTAQ